MWNARLDESQAGIKISGKNINNLRYADDTTLMTESEEELKSPLMKVKEDSKTQHPLFWKQFWCCRSPKRILETSRGPQITFRELLF